MLTLAMAVVLGGTALAQDNFYFVTYYSNANTANAPDATVRIINDGATGSDVYADIYVFDDSEELTECCSCLITPDGLLSESVNKNLTANPLTGIKPQRGVIKVLATTTSDPTSINIPSLSYGLRGFATHVQKLASGFAVTETQFQDSILSATEFSALQSLCFYDALLSGKPCTCTPEDQDF